MEVTEEGLEAEGPSPPLSPGGGGAAGDASYQPEVAQFVRKLFELVSEPATDNLVSWSPEHPRSVFTVYAPAEFAATVLPRYFKHSNFSSFVRQLNIYGFRKIDGRVGCSFFHENFRRNEPQALKDITRRKVGTHKGGAPAKRQARRGSSQKQYLSCESSFELPMGGVSTDSPSDTPSPQQQLLLPPGGVLLAPQSGMAVPAQMQTQVRTSEDMMAVFPVLEARSGSAMERAQQLDTYVKQLEQYLRMLADRKRLKEAKACEPALQRATSVHQ